MKTGGCKTLVKAVVFNNLGIAPTAYVDEACASMEFNNRKWNLNWNLSLQGWGERGARRMREIEESKLVGTL